VTLGQKQRLFTRLTGELIAYAYSQGYELTFAATYRDPAWKVGKMPERSLHGLRLAVDFNLFRNGKFLPSTEAHRPLGEWWERQHPLCRWGGRFNDGGHYSITHGGVS
jgi:hypothetical protein